MSQRYDEFDIVVIGGGVVGCSILREVARYDVRTALIERRPEICDGTSKANSGIVHTGFDAPPGSLEARLLAEARQLWPEVIDQLALPYLQTGAVMLATDEAEEDALATTVLPKAERNGVTLRRLSREEILETDPYVTPHVRAGVLVEGEGVIDPFWTTRAYAESALRNGAQIVTGEAVTQLRVEREGVFLRTSAGHAIHAALAINAAGLWADEIARLAGDDTFALTPRKGQFILTEEDAGVARIILPVPTPITKGVLVTPIVFGGVMLGPTAEEVEEKTDLSTTAEGLARIREGVGKLVPAMARASSVRQFAGIRAVSPTGDYIVRPSAVGARLLHVAGIRSTGLSASPAIGRYVATLACEELCLTPRHDFVADLPSYLSQTREGEGDVVCLCRSITRGELLAALRAPLPPATLDGLKRRTGAMLGMCQGNLCMPHILDLFQRELGRDPLAVEKHAAGSLLLGGHAKQPASALTGQEA
jgi:glycerol-3-phosphate dehydrogenase